VKKTNLRLDGDLTTCPEWLAGREAQAEARAELAQAREYRAETELSRGGRHAS